MKMMKTLASATCLAMVLSACSSTGGRLSDDWRNCMAAGTIIGGAAGIEGDADDGREGAIAGAVIGSLVCALKHKDEDGDGVSDDNDRCPGTPEGAEVDQNGCELDFDGDGVVDRLDACPDTPAGATVDARGCELDSDGDGVKDSRDRCPDTVAGASVDSDGCELDSDGDGVKDSADACPDTAAGQAVDNRGCDLTESYELRGVHFEYDSAQLMMGESMEAVHEALEILRRHADLNLEIAGHTDSKGSDEYNQALSERRAAAVRAELMKNGIDGSRLSVKGYGESKPVADNSTDEGRARNRRVELHQH